MAGNGFSGKDGDVKIGTTSVSEIKGWSFNPKSNNPRYASNKTAGYKRTVAGVKEGSGTISGVFDPTTMFFTVIDVGTNVTLKLYLDTTYFFSVPAVIDDYKLTVDLDNGEIVGFEGTFSANGAWTNPVSSMSMPEDMLSQVVSPAEFDEAKLRRQAAAVAKDVKRDVTLDPQVVATINEAVAKAFQNAAALRELADAGLIFKNKDAPAPTIASLATDAPADGADAQPRRTASMSPDEAKAVLAAKGETAPG